MKWFLLILFFTGSFFVYGQKQGQSLIDSLQSGLPALKEDSNKVKALNTLAYEYSRIDVDEGIRYGNMALSLAKQLKYTRGMAEANRFIGINYLNVTVLDTALQYFNESLQLYTGINDNEGMAKIYGGMGNLYNMEGDITRALDYHLKALSINETLKEEQTIAANLSNISVIYFELGRTEEAISMMHRAVLLNKKYNNKKYLSINYHELGRFYEFKNSFDSAYYFGNLSFITAKEIGDKTGMALGIDAMGFVEEHKKNFLRAMDLYKQALQIRIEIQNQMGITGSLGTVALCYLAMSREYADERRNYLDSTVHYANKSITIAKEINNPEWLKINYYTLFEARQMQGLPAEALEAFKISTAYKDSLLNEDKKESIKNIEDRRAIELKDKQLKITALEIENRKKMQWLFGIGIVFLTFAGALLLWQNMNRRRTNKKLALLNNELSRADQTKARFLGILNHDLRGPVANLIQFIHLQKEAPNAIDDATRSRLEQQTLSGAENLLESMENLLLWSKGQMQQFNPSFRQVKAAAVFIAIEKHFYNSGIPILFENNEDVSIYTDENFLLTIMRNLTGNAIKALNKTPHAKIIWKAFIQNAQPVLIISDNGPGMERSQYLALYEDTAVKGINSGLGLHLVRDFAKEINCSIELTTQPGKGSQFTLHFEK